ncbi:MAG: hypothetical protein JW913_01070 [Chitinispirillaceae bacterium]|nr:hypothetical protein [Chitinispirillaceae bacterium]
MDTDYLSKETYSGIIIAADNFHHDLTSEFGLLAAECKNEEEYLNNAIDLIEELKELEKDELEDVFYEKIPTVKSFHEALDGILSNIHSIMKIPMKKRHFDKY